MTDLLYILCIQNMTGDQKTALIFIGNYIFEEYFFTHTSGSINAKIVILWVVLFYPLIRK